MRMEAENVVTEYKSVYATTKQLDEQRKQSTTLQQHFAIDLENRRQEIIERSIGLLLRDHETIGRRAREILWRKGYYELISLAKRCVRTIQQPDDTGQWERRVLTVIWDGIDRYKRLIIRLERKFDLDLEYLIDFKILESDERNGGLVVEKNGMVDVMKMDANNLERINYALETIHSALISLGDLHRYIFDFKSIGRSIDKEVAAKFYYEAFKLNPKIGMAQNQLGTLFAGQNYDLDSVYHYLYSLVCAQPFELSDNNVGKIFQSKSEYLLDTQTDDPVTDQQIGDFLAKFIFIVDIFFYDKQISELNSLCHGVLVDFRKILLSNRSKFTGDQLYRLVATLLFCLSKLSACDSATIHSLNAFLVAICSHLLDACIQSAKQFFDDHAKRNDNFQQRYLKMFEDAIQLAHSDKQKSSDAREMEKMNGKDSGIIETGKSTQGSTYNSVGREIVMTNDSGGCSLGVQPKCQLSSSGKDGSAEVSQGKPLKGAKKTVQRRRRKRMIGSLHSDESDTADSEDEQEESDYSLDSDFSTDDSSDDEYVSSDDGQLKSQQMALCNSRIGAMLNGKQTPDTNGVPTPTSSIIPSKPSSMRGSHSDTDDIVIEEEEIIYNHSKDPTPNNQSIFDRFTNLHMNEDDLQFNTIATDDDNDFIVEEEQIFYSNQATERSDGCLNNGEIVIESNEVVQDEQNVETDEPIVQINDRIKHQIKYRRKYSKIDPNIIIDFVGQEKTMIPLKILFDWLKINNDILINCYKSNPEFIQKIMQLLNMLNIDIFTRRIYFPRELILAPGLRDDFRKLFDIRTAIPINEDVQLKNFPILALSQRNLDWEIPLKMNVTENEEHFVRLLKIIDFGFMICNMNRFRYNFCARSRRFVESMTAKRRRRRCDDRRNRSARDRPHQQPRRRRRRNRDGPDRRNERRRSPSIHREPNQSNENNERNFTEEYPPLKAPSSRKGYLKGKQEAAAAASAWKVHANGTTGDSSDGKTTIAAIIGKNPPSDKENKMENKSEIMGKLWLRNEVKTLELKVKKPNNLNATPYLIVDSKSLTQYLSMVKNLIHTKKFIVLIPLAVLSDLDELKKTSEGARNAIRWMERELKSGNRFLRSQRASETLSIPLLKVPKRLDRDANTFLQIAQFCNFIKATYGTDEQPPDSVDETLPPILTLLTGDNLRERKPSSQINWIGVLDLISVKYEMIRKFYGKCKNK